MRASDYEGLAIILGCVAVVLGVTSIIAYDSMKTNEMNHEYHMEHIKRDCPVKE